MVTRIKSSQITDGTILNADVNASAAVAATKVSGLAASATTDTTNAANIGSGILPLARLGSGTAGQVLKVASPGSALEFGAAGGITNDTGATFNNPGTFTAGTASQFVVVMSTGAGGGGGGGTPAGDINRRPSGNAGGNTTFGTLVAANGGNGGQGGQNAGSNQPGSAGNAGTQTGSFVGIYGAGRGSTVVNSAFSAASKGGGGSGGSGHPTNNAPGGSGGAGGNAFAFLGSGEYGSTQSVTVGGGGTGGPGNGTGGNGQGGQVLLVDMHA
jgi:hypothetical protein